ncbi:MAG: bifunctional glutamine-synthetase adenylyltransferase/deadenyltransferase, partial [Aquiluna sp.]
MSTNRANPLSELARLGFESLSETMPKLDLLVDAVGDWGRSALSYLAKTQSPDQALNGLLRLAEQQPKQIAKLLSSEDSGVRLCRLLGASDGILDLLVRRPELLDQLRRPAAIPEKFSVERTDRSALRRSYREQFFAIADFDLAQEDARACYQVVAKALADLTDQTLEAALEVGKAELLADGRISQDDADQTALAVIAMGKTGAQELNYISDVDVIYVADGEAENTVEVATKLATRLAQVIGEYGDEPPLWEVDPNLRPEGKSGALVRTLPAHRAYYEKWAEPWEFQALLKARFAAGDASLGERYIATIKPMIWAYPERSRIVESARHLRRRVLEHLPANEQHWNLKLGRGGL